LAKIVFKGTVFSGKGEGKKFIGLLWVKRQIEAKLGFSPYSGTLNIRLTKESLEKIIKLENTSGIRVEPQAGYCPGILYTACIEGLYCAVVVPQIPNYPSDVLEVIASVCLREQLKLVDGSSVTVSINV
jgi:riboflavin kinase